MDLFSWKQVAISGHRVLVVLDKSPGATAGLVPFLDLVTHVEGQQVDDDKNSLVALLGCRVDLATELSVYNIKSGKRRKCSIVSHCKRNRALAFPFNFGGLPLTL